MRAHNGHRGGTISVRPKCRLFYLSKSDSYMYMYMYKGTGNSKTRTRNIPLHVQYISDASLTPWDELRTCHEPRYMEDGSCLCTSSKIWIQTVRLEHDQDCKIRIHPCLRSGRPHIFKYFGYIHRGNHNIQGWSLTPDRWTACSLWVWRCAYYSDLLTTVPTMKYWSATRNPREPVTCTICIPIFPTQDEMAPSRNARMWSIQSMGMVQWQK